MNFEVGDKVICLKDYTCPYQGETQFTAGSVYIITEIKEPNCLVEKDDLGNTDNGWLIKYFKRLDN